MRAWRFHEPGNIANLVLEEVDTPPLNIGEALVRLECAALNPADRYLVQGQYPRAGAPPFTPGRDGAGTVVEVGPDSRFTPGDKVCLLGGGLTGVSLPGTLAEYAPLPEAWLAPIPDAWTFEQAATTLTSLTAWRALEICGGLQSNDTVLVTGASGGVGVAAVFLAKALGARIVALSRSAEKRKNLIALGADAAIDTESSTLEKEVRAAAGDQPISLVIENLGGPYLEKSVRMVAPEGRIMVIGLLADLTATVTIGLLIHKNIRIQGMSVNNFKAKEAQDAWTKIVDLYNANHHRPPISQVFPFAQVQEAFAHLQAGPMGKVLVRCSA